MKKHYILIAALLSASFASDARLAGFSYDDSAAPSGDEWQDCRRLALNKEQPRAWFFSFADENEASNVLPQNSSFYKSLDGVWKFNWVGNPDLRPADFFRPDYDVKKWDNITVPGNWNVQGIAADGSLNYGVPVYCNQWVIFQHKVAVDDWRGGVMREPPSDWTTYRDRNEVGSYRRTFSIPAEWEGREVYVNFDGVDSFFYLWVNGAYVGFSKNSRNTASFDITPHLRKGENTIAVEVYRNSDGSMLEAQDMFRLPGIFRSVYLTAVPQISIRDLRVNPSLSGNIDIFSELQNLSGASVEGLTIDYSVFPVKLYSADLESANPVAQVRVAGDSAATTSIAIPQPRLWSAEQPARYLLLTRLFDKEGNIIETVSTYFGIRQVEIAGDRFLINGQPVKLRGVNRHETNPQTGHAVSRQQMLGEILLMKRNNINHVRTSHYSDSPYWYELCDRFGIYLEDEANIESHEYYYGAASLSHPVEWRDAHVARVMEMAQAHVNHPSVVIWSLGNEAGPGDNFKAAYAELKKFDPSRPVQYERNNDIVDMGSNQYPDLPWVIDAAAGRLDIKYPFHISEYAHSMGNAGGNLAEIWQAIDSSDLICGAAIWDWVDQALWHVNFRGQRYFAYGGDFGDKPNSNTFCMNGLLFPDFSPKPELAEVKHVYQPVSVTMTDSLTRHFEIFNKNYFTPLDDQLLHWTLLRDGIEVDSGEVSLDIPPRSSIAFNPTFQTHDLDTQAEYYISFDFRLNQDRPWAKAGYTQMQTQILLSSPLSPDRSDLPDLSVRSYSSDLSDLSEISNGSFRAVFDNALGTLYSLSYNNQVIIDDGGSISFDPYRAPVDNDIWAVKSWRDAGINDLRHSVTAMSCDTLPDGTMRLAYKLDIIPTDSTLASPLSFKAEHIWSVRPDGTITFTSSQLADRTDFVLPRIGYSMQLNPDLDHVTYYGRGPLNNYPDRKEGSLVGLFKSSVDDFFVPFPRPQDMANREDVRWITLTDSSGRGVRFTASPLMSASVLRYSDRQLAEAAHTVDLPESRGITLHLDRKVLGLGGASCGQDAPLLRDRPFADSTPFTFTISPNYFFPHSCAF